MSLARLAWAYLAARPLLTALHVMLLALGVATMAFLLLFTSQAEERFARDARPVDLVVGAKGSPLQLILSTLLQADVPTGNIPEAEARRIAAHPMVASAVPLALGDSYRGARIVGTTADYLRLYGARVAEGRVFEAPMEAVAGADVARRHRLAPGTTIAGNHGLAASGGAHDAHPFRIVGVLAATGTVADRVVVTSVASVRAVHDDTRAEGDITALLVRYRTPLAAATLPRFVNASTSLQAASPAFEIARLMDLVGAGVATLRLFAGVLLAGAALSILAALAAALQERRYDLALLRALGAPPSALMTVVMVEGVTLLGVGVILGLALGHGAAEVLGRWIARSGAWSLTGLAFEPAEAALAAAVVAVGLAACLVPAVQAYRRDPAILLKR